MLKTNNKLMRQRIKSWHFAERFGTDGCDSKLNGRYVCLMSVRREQLTTLTNHQTQRE